MQQSIGSVSLVVRESDEALAFVGTLGFELVFRRPPKEEPDGTVAVVEDLCGNLWDLLELKA